MGQPRKSDTYESYTDQLVYFRARLLANPDTASLAESIEKVLTKLDADNEAIRDARRAEVQARAQRDHQDGLGDAQVRRFKRRIDAIGDAELTQRLFPRGLNHVIAPRGRAQIERLSALVQAIDELAASPRVAAHQDVEEIKEVLDKGKATLADARDKLATIVEAWEAEVRKVARAVDELNFDREEGVDQFGAVLGELRAKLGGDAKAAYAYTQQRTDGASESEDEAEAEDEA